MSLALEELVDVSTFAPGEDGQGLRIGLTGQRITGARVALEWVLRSWLTPRGVLRNKARGIDVRALENATVGPGDLDRWRAALIAEAQAVEYVKSCAVDVSLDGRAIAITAALVLVNGKTYSLAVRLVDAAATITIGGA